LQRKLFATAVCSGLPVRYYLLRRQGTTGQCYGIRVDYNGETVTAADLSASEMQVRQLLGMLVRGCVTPVTIADILEDWLLR